MNYSVCRFRKADWCLKGQQKRVMTPGKNQKHYLAGCLDAQTGRVTYVSGIKKNSDLFINLLKELNGQYRHAKNITLIVDNYGIHKSRKVGHGENKILNLICCFYRSK
ncbi:transposase (fragment) [Xenorhabdus nematophila AN6/1]